MTHSVYIALGSNIGDRLANLQSAIRLFAPAIEPLICSAVYETPPWGYLDQASFLNQVVLATTELSPHNLLARLKKLESDLGRMKTFKNGPRVIDLDLLLYDDEVIESPPLIVPHPRIDERAFVLVPLAEISPDLIHPVLKQSFHVLLDQVDASGIHRYAPGGCPKMDLDP
jgi:2-amino-4-hydroxy-6-hydroxymethyldihydropteridine diphosphokinase